MPIYEYICGECCERFSLLRGINATDNVECPKCESTDVRKVMSSFCCSSGVGGSGFSSSSPSGGFSGGG